MTDLLRQQSQLVSRLITHESGMIYVCGDAQNMSKDVNLAIKEILKTENGNSLLLLIVTSNKPALVACGN